MERLELRQTKTINPEYSRHKYTVIHSLWNNLVCDLQISIEDQTSKMLTYMINGKNGNIKRRIYTDLWFRLEVQCYKHFS